VIYLADASAQDLIRQDGLAGEVKNTNGDYLMVVDANLTGLKMDQAVNRSIDYRLEQSYNGLFGKLKVIYAHRGGADEKAASYKTYTRVYLPLGSELIKAEGLSQGQAEVTNELGKTCFGAFISIEPGKIGSLYFEYKLPYETSQLTGLGAYELLIQKQPGNDIKELTVDLRFINPVKSYDPTGFNVIRLNNQIKWQTDLKTDREFKVNF